MATYTELSELENNSDLRNKVRVAIAIAADKIAKGTDTGANFDQTAGAHDARKAWVLSENAFDAGSSTAQKFWNAMLAANNSAGVGAITGASDATIQSAVEQVIDIFSGN